MIAAPSNEALTLTGPRIVPCRQLGPAQATSRFNSGASRIGNASSSALLD